MKKIIFILMLSVSLFAETKFENDFKIGIITQNIQDTEGSGVYLAYRVYKNFMIETSYNVAYLRGIKVDATNESWNEYTTQRFGVRWYLASYAENKIKLFASAGLEYLYENDITTDKMDLNRYLLGGVELSINSWSSISFSMSSTGKGAFADKLEGKPSYAHGFTSAIAVEFNF